jgi:hypothetical protein
MLAKLLFASLALLSGASYLESTLKIATINILSLVYNNPNWFVVAPGYDVYYNDTYRINTLLSHLDSMTDVSTFMFQEVSATAPCLTDSNILLPGHLELLVAKMATLGYECEFAAHDIGHWWKYYDYDGCTAYNAYRPTGNLLCLKSVDFTAVAFYSESLNNGSSIVVADATFKGVRNMSLASIHFDSDVAGIRRQEFVTTFYDNHPPQLERPFIACGDYNTFWTPANLRHAYLDSGYTDPLYNYALATGVIIPPSQPLTEEWYGSRNHRGKIDHCILPVGAGILYPQLWQNTESRYGYPDSTASGVMDFQLWAEYPAPAKQGNDLNEPIRNGETLKRWGSDHYGVRYAIKITAQ